MVLMMEQMLCGNQFIGSGLLIGLIKLNAFLRLVSVFVSDPNIVGDSGRMA